VAELKRLLIIVSAIFLPLQALPSDNARCPQYQPGIKQVYWGDLHVHSAYSLDAWGYGTAATPAQAYAFARGGTIKLTPSLTAQLERPLDFMAVTDHAEWFNLLYICTDPEWSDDAYCNIMTEKNNRQDGPEVFAEYVLPTITKAQPKPTPICINDPSHCDKTMKSQWQRIQNQSNAANDPCQFTTFVGFEWSATPEFSHNHRNVIFRSDVVPKQAIDYMNFPSPEQLWNQLDQNCRPEDGCQALVIPHNTNMGDGKSFEVETASDQLLSLRAKYEKLIEIHQEKGNSECLPAFGQTDEDCNFELYLTKNSKPMSADDYSLEQWEKMRSGYVRGLLKKGLVAYQKSAEKKLNPLKMGIIGSTDNHAATGGLVEENQWKGSVFGIGNLDRSMIRASWNPGGLVGVWAEENTRDSLFAALQRREVYGTSGPRIQVRLQASTKKLDCQIANPDDTIVMGGELSKATHAPHFQVEVLYDKTPIQSIEIIKGELRNGVLAESRSTIWEDPKAGLTVCATWQDVDFDATAPAFWYARVIEAATPRWSAVHCKQESRCDEFPNAEKTIQERAWTSPIWYLP